LELASRRTPPTPPAVEERSPDRLFAEWEIKADIPMKRRAFRRIGVTLHA
jgi:hypothetical protein